jgi:predicted TIM-barrel fold metal-dependent hydrolase
VRWQFAAVPPFDGSGVAMAIGSAKGPGPRVVRLHPGLHGGYPLASWLLAPLPELCDTADVAIVLDYTASLSVPWVEIVELARRNPSLCLVCVGGGRNGELGVLRAFLDAVANVVVELSALDDPAWLTRAVSEVGAHRFVFGSGGDQSRAVALLESASLAPEDAALVASGVAGLIDQGSWTETWL